MIPGGTVTELTGRKRPYRTYGAVVGIGPNIRYGVPNNNLVNLRRAIVERQFFVEQQGQLVRVQVPENGVFEQRLAKFSRKFSRLYPHACKIPLVDFPGLYHARKRTIYQRAVDSLLVKPLVRTDSYLSSFIKAEKTLINERKPNPVPRIISPRLPRYNAAIGSYIKNIEHKIYRVTGRLCGSPVI